MISWRFHCRQVVRPELCRRKWLLWRGDKLQSLWLGNIEALEHNFKRACVSVFPLLLNHIVQYATTFYNVNHVIHISKPLQAVQDGELFEYDSKYPLHGLARAFLLHTKYFFLGRCWGRDGSAKESEAPIYPVFQKVERL
jgi:hypothetical protein